MDKHKVSITKKMDNWIEEYSLNIKLTSWLIWPSILIILGLNLIVRTSKYGSMIIGLFFLSTIFPVTISYYLKINKPEDNKVKKWIPLFLWSLLFLFFSFGENLNFSLQDHKEWYLKILVGLFNASISILLAWYLSDIILSFLKRSKQIIKSENFDKAMKFTNKAIVVLISIIGSIVTLLLSIKELLS